MYINIANSINDIRKSDWDLIAHDGNPYASYGWLKLVEETYIGNLTPQYVQLCDSDRLIGAAVCAIFNKADNVLSLDDAMFGRFKKYLSITGISFLPLFICRPINSYGTHFLVENNPDHNKMRDNLNKLLQGMEKIAFDQRLSVTFSHLMDNEVELIHLLDNSSYSNTLGFPISYLDIEWASFSDYIGYMSSISKSRARNIRRQLNKNRKEGVIVRELENPDGYEDLLYNLVNDHYYKYNHIPFPFRKDFFTKLKEYLGKDAIIYISIKRDKITGVSSFLKNNNVLYSLAYGKDQVEAADDFTYFNLGYYTPTMDAIANHIRRIYFGGAMYGLKARVGCKIGRTYIFHKSYNKAKNRCLKPWFAYHSMCFSRKLRKAECGGAC